MANNVTKLEAPQAPQQEPPKRSILMAMAERYGMEPEPFEATVRATCFPATPPATREEFAAGMQIAYRLELNPITKEVHFARTKGGGVQGLIGIDGWFVMANRHPQYDGCEFEKTYETDGNGKKTLTAITCRIFRKDRPRPTEIEELMSECIRPGSEAWKLTPSRMLRHRAFGQCARLAFSFVGVMDTDEFARWQEMKDVTPKQSVLAVPTDIDDGQSPQPTSEAEASQDGPLPNPEKYLAHLETQLKEAETRDEFVEIWAAHQELESRLSEADRATAQTMHEDQVKRFDPQEAQLDLEPPAEKKKGKK